MAADEMQRPDAGEAGESSLSVHAFAPVPWTVGDVLRGSLAALGLLVLGLMLVVTAGVLAGVSGSDLTSPAATHLIVYATMALEAVFILPAWWWGPRKHQVGVAWLGLRPPSVGRVPLLTAGAFVAILAIEAGWAAVAARLGLPGQPDVVPLFGEGPGGLVVALITACGIAPVAEEIFFRGFMFAGMRDQWGLAPALVVSALVFATMHFSLSTLLPIAAMGVILALLYQRTNSLWPCVILHALVNLLGVLGAYAVQ